MEYELKAATAEWNPPAERLRELTELMPNSQKTEFGNVVVKARVDARSTRSTFIVDDSTNTGKQTIDRAEYGRIAALQDAYIAGSHMVAVDGYIGSDPAFRTRARLIIETANANVAGMQKQLYYPVEDGYDPAGWQPELSGVTGQIRLSQPPSGTAGMGAVSVRVVTCVQVRPPSRLVDTRSISGSGDALVLPGADDT